MKISLSVITGNCEQDINRFLDVFQPHFDEVVIVRAIGWQDPDNTIKIAKERGCKIGTYYNESQKLEQDFEGEIPDEMKWPHVDDFAAARNASAELCTGDWIVWADLDDDASGLEILRDKLAGMRDDVGILKCPYVVGDQGVVANYRERAWRNNGAYHWLNAIHENLTRKDGAAENQARTDEIKIIHAPRADRDCTQDRNMRILESIPEADRTHGHTFYLMTEYARRKDARAIEVAKQFLAHPESATPERFETFMTLAHMAEDADQKAAIYTQAFTEDPTRSEPLYELAALSLACDQPERALAYAKHMMTAEWPENPCWNHRRMFYGFFRDDLFWQCLRTVGRVEESDARRDNMMAREKQAGATTISLIHATRGRPAQAARCRMEWLRLADHPERIEHIFAVDMDDDAAAAFVRFPSVYLPGYGGPVAAWNMAAQASKGDILVQLSDDWKPTKGWDTAIVDAIGDATKPAVLAVDDGHRKDNLLCMAILTRARYNYQGYMFHPELFSMYSDNWFSHCAFRDGVVIDARERITFEHMHPAFRKSEIDETYARSNQEYHYLTGSRIFDRLKAGIRVSSEIDGWFDFPDVYQALAYKLEGNQKFVEVGAWKGKSICYLRDRLDDMGRTDVEVIAVDTFEGDDDTGRQDVFRDFMANVGERKIAVMQTDSISAAQDFDDASLNGVFIDAAHDYDSVKADIEAWRNKLKPGGFFGGHDVDAEGVQRALADCGIKYAVHGRCWIQNKDEIEHPEKNDR